MLLRTETFDAYSHLAHMQVLADRKVEGIDWARRRTRTSEFRIVMVENGVTNSAFHLIDLERRLYVSDQQNKRFSNPLAEWGGAVPVLSDVVHDHDETALLIGGMRNHWHFLINFLPRLLMARALLGPELDGVDSVVINTPTPAQRKFLARVFPDVRFRELPEDRTQGHRFRRLLYPSFLPNTVLVPEALHATRAAIGAAFDTAAIPDTPDRIFVDRDPKIPRRRLAARHVGMRILERHGVVPIICEKHDLRSQIALFSRARFVAGLHGAGLANILFCALNTPVLILDYKWPSEMHGLAQAMGLRPFTLLAQPQPDPDREPRLRDLKVPGKQLDAALTAFLGPLG